MKNINTVAMSRSASQECSHSTIHCNCDATRFDKFILVAVSRRPSPTVAARRKGITHPAILCNCVLTAKIWLVATLQELRQIQTNEPFYDVTMTSCRLTFLTLFLNGPIELKCTYICNNAQTTCNITYSNVQQGNANIVASTTTAFLLLYNA